ncbi:MAG: DUF4340 domain-containing protein [Pirellulaceae bacterium]
MSESVKTLIFAAVAVVAVLVTVFTYPKQEDFQPPQLQGKALFADFTDPGAAAKLSIVRFSEDLGQLTEFEVARDPKTGLWSIPSSSNYPADAEAQMRDAATSLIDLQVLGVASDDTKDHHVFGVIEPDKQKLDASQVGVGLLVSFQDAKNRDLASLIIGKRVKGSEDQNFVRKPSEPTVYVVKIDPSKFPTEFDKWIERDLLKLNTMDVDRITLKDYSIVTTQTLTGPRGKLDERFEAQVTWDSNQSKWVLNELVQIRTGQKIRTELLPTEELNSQKHNDLKTALGNVQIVGVLRKPIGLGADLKAGNEIMNDQDGLSSLMNRGFFPVMIEGGEPEIRAANGEVLVGLKDGVEYVLRFGEIASVDEEQEGKDSQINRYLFVTARLDQSKFPPLQLDPLPGEQESPEAAKETAAADGQEATTSVEATPAPGDTANEQEAKKEEAPGEKTDLELERERIRKENQRKQDERDEKLKKATERISELNARFADWYYIISEDGYKKIQLGRNDLIAEKQSATQEGFGVDSLRQLEEEGIKTQPADPDAKVPPPSMPPFDPGQQ